MVVKYSDWNKDTDKEILKGVYLFSPEMVDWIEKWCSLCGGPVPVFDLLPNLQWIFCKCIYCTVWRKYIEEFSCFLLDY